MNLAKTALLLIVLASPAKADRVSVLLGSHHVEPEMQFNETNPGVFYTHERGPWQYTVGAYRNSYNRNSVAATVGRDVVSWRDGALSAFAGVAHYPEDGRTFVLHVGDVVPLAGLQVRHGNTFAQVIPSDGAYTKAIISFGFTWQID